MIIADGETLAPPRSLPPSLLMSMLVGSSSQSPVFPLGARVSTMALSPKCRSCPEVSTKPPSPPIAPPIALMMPEKSVRPFDHTTNVPPLPRRVASALIVALPTVTFAAFREGPAPCRSPPICTVPPPAEPEASILVLSATVMLCPLTSTKPPVWPLPLPVAVIVPLTFTSPSPPSITTSPFCSLALVAVTMPVLLITAPAMSAAARAVMITRPPLLAWIVPELETPVWPLSALPAGAAMA